MSTAARNLIERLVTKDDYFHLPHVADENPLDPWESYYYDLHIRVDYPGDLKNGLPVIKLGNDSYVNPVGAAQFGLAHLQHYWDTGNEEYLRGAERISAALVNTTEEDLGLVWRHPISMRENCDWISSMAQDQVASLLLRVGELTDDELLIDKGRAVLVSLDYDIEDGGVRAVLNGHLWFEDYAIAPPAYTLNGFIVTLFGIRDAAIILKDEHYGQVWTSGVESLISNLQLWDSDGWSLYDLLTRVFGPVSLSNFASPFCQRFHIESLSIMEDLTRESAFAHQRKRWSKGLEEGFAFYRAVFGKVMYRLLTPTAYAEFQKVTR